MMLLDNKLKSSKLGIVHFIGIGGIGMSGIAEIMHNLGYIVQGSDASASYNTARLESKGIKVFIGHKAKNTYNASYVVISTAIKPDNEELVAALERSVVVIKRSEMLAELMRLKTSIAISGSHGKTTTTSLVACLFEAAGLEPTVINGGVINQKLTNAYLGSGEYLIAEADESDATFIKIPSTIGVITNIDPEHMDYYKDFDSLFAAFKSFIANLPFYSFGVACIDHHNVRRLVGEVTNRRILTYGIDSEDAHVRAFNINCDVSFSTFDVEISLPNSSGKTIIREIYIPTTGRHNVLNALAALTIGIELDFGLKVLRDGFKKFAGVKRRFTKVFEYNGTEIIDDYAHHPVEVEATLAAARNIANKRKSEVIAVFQPHRYSRLENLFEDFCKCFSSADKVYILDIYAAGEKPIEGITIENLLAGIKKHHPKTEYVSHQDELASLLQKNTAPGNLFLMMGAGTISSWAYSLESKLTHSAVTQENN